MAMVINDPYGKGKAGQSGENISKLVSGGLQQLAHHKMQQISQRHQAKAYQDLGIPADLAGGLARLSPEERNIVLKNIGENQGFQGGQQAQGQPGQQMSQGQQQQGQKMPEPWQVLQQRPVTKQQKEMYKDARSQQSEINKTLNPSIEKTRKAANAASKEKSTYSNLRKLIASGELTSASTVRLANSLSKNAKYIAGGIGSFLGASIGAAGGPGSAATGAIQGGSLGASLGSAIPKFTGNTADQAYKKGVYSFFKQAKDWFGSQIPVGEAQIFLETLPTLEMDDEAKLVVLDQMEAMGDLAEATNKAQNDIIREHGGHPPANLDELIHERIGEQQQQVAQSITESMDRLLASQKQGYLERPKSWLPG